MAFGFSYSFKLQQMPPLDLLEAFMDKHDIGSEASHIQGEVLYTKSEFSVHLHRPIILIWFYFGTSIRFRPQGNQILVTFRNKITSGLMILLLLLILGLFFGISGGNITLLSVTLAFLAMLGVYGALGLRLLASGLYLKGKLEGM